MSRTGTYWSDHNGRLNCAHGVLLHGTRCVQCERGDLPEPRSFIADAMRAVRSSGRFSEGGVFGFDLGKPGGDQTAFVRGQRVGEGFEWTADDLKTAWTSPLNGNDEQMAARRKVIDEAVERLAKEIAERARRGEGWGGPYDTSKRWQHSRGDPRPRETHWHVPHPRAPEIITDPNDSRGYSARRVGDERAPLQS